MKELDMKNPLVSILIPVYNREKLISYTIESALNQTYENIEIIVVDNKSTDKTFEILKEYGKKDKRIKVFQNKENIGPVKNWKKCLECSSGEYIKILFSDDWMDKKFIEKSLQILDKTNIAFVYSAAVIHFGNKEVIAYRIYQKDKIIDSEQFIKGAVIGGDFPVSPSCAIFKRKDIENNLIINIPNDLGLDFSTYGAGNDLLLFLLTALKYRYIGFLSMPLSHFRGHKDSFSCSKDLSLYYLYAKKYFLDNFYENKKLKEQFYAKMYLRNIKKRGTYKTLIDKKYLSFVNVTTEAEKFLIRKFKKWILK